MNIGGALFGVYIQKGFSMEETEKELYPIGIEQDLWAEGHEHVAGVDEVGRGAWAGPIIGAAVSLPQHIMLDGIRDSKRLKKKRLDLLDTAIRETPGVHLYISVQYVNDIESVGIDESNVRVMTDAIEHLAERFDVNAFIVDGCRIGKLVTRRVSTPSLFVCAYDKAETKSQAVAAASVIAKVYRDGIMDGLSNVYPQYAFDKNKGYGTKEHYEAIKQHGFCKQHRLSFKIKGLEHLYAQN